MTKKFFANLFIFAMIAASLPGCGDVKRVFGVDRAVPDEFEVVENPPLVIPPNFELRPPQDDAPAPQSKPVEEAAKETLMLNSMVGQDAGADKSFPVIENVEVAEPDAVTSQPITQGAYVAEGPRETVPMEQNEPQPTQFNVAPSQAEILARAGNDPSIRKTVDKEDKAEAKQDQRPEVIKKLLFWQKPGPTGKVVDPSTEQARLKQQGNAPDPFAPDAQQATASAQSIVMPEPTPAPAPTVNTLVTEPVPPATIPFLTQSEVKSRRHSLLPPPPPTPVLCPPQPTTAPAQADVATTDTLCPTADDTSMSPSDPLEAPSESTESTEPSAEAPAPIETSEPTEILAPIESITPADVAGPAETVPTVATSPAEPIIAKPFAKTAQELYPSQWSTLGPKRAPMPSGQTAPSVYQQHDYRSVIVTNALPKKVVTPKKRPKKRSKKRHRKARHVEQQPAPSYSFEATQDPQTVSDQIETQQPAPPPVESAPTSPASEAAPITAPEVAPEVAPTTPPAQALPEAPASSNAPEAPDTGTPPASDVESAPEGDASALASTAPTGTILQPGAPVESIYQTSSPQS